MIDDLDLNGRVRVVLEGVLVAIDGDLATVNVAGAPPVRVRRERVSPDPVAQEAADYWAGESRRKAEEMQG